MFPCAGGATPDRSGHDSSQQPTPPRCAQHYDDLDHWYLTIWGEHFHHELWETGAETVAVAVVQLTQRVAERAHIGKGTRVVDIGCGYGATARLLNKEYSAEVIGYTISNAQYEYAMSRTKTPDDLKYRLQDWNANDLPDCTIDVALSIESSEHMEDKPMFFAEAFRVLKPGGRLVICAWLTKDAPRSWEVKHLLEPICREGRLPAWAMRLIAAYNTRSLRYGVFTATKPGGPA